jgi:hypothetical protein
LRSFASTRTGRVQAEAVDVSAQRLAGRTCPRHLGPECRHLLPGARAESDAASHGCRLQRPLPASLISVGVGLGQVGLAHAFMRLSSHK